MTMNISFMVCLRYKKQKYGKENIRRIGNKMEIMGKTGVYQEYFRVFPKNLIFFR